MGLARDSGFRKSINERLSAYRNMKTARSYRGSKSFSQLGEDAMLQSFLPQGSGFYVDMGSGSPIEGSNTYALYLMGWRGILIDPIASNMELSRRIRPGDKCVLTLCGRETGHIQEFFEFETYQYSTTVESRAEEMQALGHRIRATYPLKTTRVTDLLPDVIPPGPTLLSIDAEGVELEILQGNDWTRFVPNFIIVEEWEPPIRRETDISRFLESQGYSLIGFSGVSCLYKHTG